MAKSDVYLMEPARSGLGQENADGLRPTGEQHDRVAPQPLPGDINANLFAGLGAGIANREEGLGDAGGVVQREPVLGGQLLDG